MRNKVKVLPTHAWHYSQCSKLGGILSATAEWGDPPADSWWAGKARGAFHVAAEVAAERMKRTGMPQVKLRERDFFYGRGAGVIDGGNSPRKYNTSIMAVTYDVRMHGITPCILVWRYEDAPWEYQHVSPHGSDEDWVVFTLAALVAKAEVVFAAGPPLGMYTVSAHSVRGGEVRIWRPRTK